MEEMDAKTAIEYMHSIRRTPANWIVEYEAIDKAIEALEKQIPKKPIWEDGHCCCPNRHKSVLRGIPYWTIMTRQKYCDYCGQAIDWSEVEL